jgi:hypothetical protein
LEIGARNAGVVTNGGNLKSSKFQTPSSREIPNLNLQGAGVPSASAVES